jgi:hypothetical protein
MITGRCLMPERKRMPGGTLSPSPEQIESPQSGRDWPSSRTGGRHSGSWQFSPDGQDAASGAKRSDGMLDLAGAQSAPATARRVHLAFRSGIRHRPVTQPGSWIHSPVVPAARGRAVAKRTRQVNWQCLEMLDEGERTRRRKQNLKTHPMSPAEAARIVCEAHTFSYETERAG